MSLLSAALALAKRGFSVFPCYAVRDAGRATARCACPLGADCGSPGKHPIGHTARSTRGDGGVKVATRDRAQLRDWWTRWPDLNPAVRTGLDDLLVLDVDGAEGFATLARLEGELGALPATLTARSGRAEGGTHLWFRDAALAALGSRKIASGLDLKASGGYVVAPGARHKSGTLYAWTKDAPVAALPAAWEAWAQSAIQDRERVETLERPRFEWTGDRSDRVGKLLARLAAAPEGARNDTLNEVAFTLGGLHAGGQIEDVRARLLDVALSIGLDPRESEATIRSGWTRGTAKPLLPRAPRQTPEDLAATQATVAHMKARREQSRTQPVLEETTPVLEEAGPTPAPPRLGTRRSSAAPEQSSRELAPQDPDPLPEDLRWGLARLAEQVHGLHSALPTAPPIDDDRDGWLVRVVQSVDAVLLDNDVGLASCRAFTDMLAGRFLREDPALQLEPLGRWAHNTLKRQQRGQTNYAVRTLMELLGDAEATGLVNALVASCPEWAKLDPLAKDLKEFEHEKLKHRRFQGQLLRVLETLDEGGSAVDDGLRKSFAAAIHCGAYCVVHRADCCDCVFARSTRVCELFWCPWCGPRQRAERSRLAAEIWAKHHDQVDLAYFEVDPACSALEVTALRQRITKKLAKRDFVQEWRWFEVPGLILVVSTVDTGSSVCQFLGEKDASAHWVRRVPIPQAIAAVQKALHDRVRAVVQVVERVSLALHQAAKGDAKAQEKAAADLRYLSAGGWARDLRWTGGSQSSHETLPWPTRQDVRAVLKEKAEAARALAGRASAEPPEKCPAHGGKISIDLEHLATRRVVAARLRYQVHLLDAVRLDDQRLTNVPAKKKREPKIYTPEQMEKIWAASDRRYAAYHARD